MFSHPMGSLLVSRVQEDAFTRPWSDYWYQESRTFTWKRKMRLLIHGEFTGIRSPEVSHARYVYSSVKSLLISGVQEFHVDDAFNHPWRVYWYQESRNFRTKIRLLIHGEFTGIRSTKISYGRCVYKFTGIRSPEVSYGRCVYSSMKSLLVSVVQEFHMEEVFTQPWRVYWYQEYRSFIWKMRWLIHGEITDIRSSEVSYGRCVYSSLEWLLVSGV